jgi:release factor glutamine methyltransferase
LKVKDAIRYIIDSIGDIYNPGESESIAFIVLDFIGFPRKKIFSVSNTELTPDNVEFIRKTVKELKTSRPIQYILGETEFYGLRFKLDENVLIPRQETEELVSTIIRENKLVNPIILDLGTGSGCIAVTIAKNIPDSKVYATDISVKAIQIAQLNAELNNVEVSTIVDDIFTFNLKKNLGFDIIVSNPPYVRDLEKQYMHENVLNYEPYTALFVRDENPLQFYEAIASIASERLNNGGMVFVEINENFGFEVMEIFKARGLQNPIVIRDINEKDRFVKAI